MDVLSLFENPILRAPLIACISMGVASGLMGVILFYQRQSLMGEALSHAAYPGIVLGILLAFLFDVREEVWQTLLAFLGASSACCLGALLIRNLRFVRGMSRDSALSFVLASGFAVALLSLSILQSEVPGVGKKAQSFLLGQAATISDSYAYTSACFALLVICLVAVHKRTIETSLFDKDFAQFIGLSSPAFEFLFFFLLSTCVMIGMKTMGVVLLSSVLVFPAVSGRYLARSLKGQFFFSSFLGASIGGAGVLLSDVLALQLVDSRGDSLWLPTGPLIVLLFQAVFILIFFFSPSEGLFFRWARRVLFIFRCRSENALKGLWKEHTEKKSKDISILRIKNSLPASFFARLLVFQTLRWKGYISKRGNQVRVTSLGLMRGQKLVRLHRLWELYLVRFCGMAKERVHPHAEIMEHILTPEVEEELVLLLKNPKKDPHDEPIPS